nr:hypothetical protein [uncultured organism]
MYGKRLINSKHTNARRDLMMVCWAERKPRSGVLQKKYLKILNRESIGEDDSSSKLRRINAIVIEQEADDDASVERTQSVTWSTKDWKVVRALGAFEPKKRGAFYIGEIKEGGRNRCSETRIVKSCRSRRRSKCHLPRFLRFSLLE